MSIKQALESNIVIVVSVVAVSAAGMGWGACEAIRVSNKTDRIAELEKRNIDPAQKEKIEAVAIDPYKRQIAELISQGSQRGQAPMALP
jgi:ribulose bisphosphate carboxylase small subunit